jgi:hypothetical protein
MTFTYQISLLNMGYIRRKELNFYLDYQRDSSLWLHPITFLKFIKFLQFRPCPPGNLSNFMIHRIAYQNYHRHRQLSKFSQRASWQNL